MKVSQRASGIARLCHKSKTRVPGDSPPSCNLGNQEKSQTQQWLSAQPNREVMDGSHALLRTASQKSVSTDEGSSLSGYSSVSPVGSEVSNGFHPHSELTPSKPDAKEIAVRQPLADLPVQVCTPHAHAPLWVGNGLKGDEAAWLLVLPKFSELNSEGAKHGRIVVPKSPKDAVLLGPYVTTKNTFLEESRVGGMRLQQRLRAQSLGALR